MLVPKLAVVGRAKAIPRENALHLARVLRPIVEERFSNNQTKAAKAWGIAQSHLSQILLAEGRGAGIAVLIRIRNALDMSLDDMLGLPPVKSAPAPSHLDEIRAALRAELAEMQRPTPTEPPLLPPAPQKGHSDAPRARRR